MVKILFFALKISGKKQYYPFQQDLLSAGRNTAVFPEYFNFFSKRQELRFISDKCSWKKKMEGQKCQEKQSFCVMAGKKKYMLFIVTVSTLTIQQGRWDNKWEKAIGQNKRSEINDWNKNWDKNNWIIEWKT